jgi:hypothetical protein
MWSNSKMLTKSSFSRKCIQKTTLIGGPRYTRPLLGLFDPYLIKGLGRINLEAERKRKGPLIPMFT